MTTIIKEMVISINPHGPEVSVTQSHQRHWMGVSHAECFPSWEAAKLDSSCFCLFICLPADIGSQANRVS